MKFYLDDDSASALLAHLLTQEGHDAQTPRGVELTGADDAVHLAHAIREGQTFLSRNFRDFQNLHNLPMQAQGHHPGILMVRRDNDPTRDLSPRGIVLAIGKLERSSLPLADHFHILSFWR